MKNRFCAFLLFFGVSVFNYSHAQVKIYPIDSWHSNIRFIAKFGGTLDVQGTFNSFEGSLTFNDQDMMQLSATIIIEAGSIDTNVEVRDKHLKGEDYFGVDKNPFIRFTSSEVKKRKGQYYLAGELELQGVKKIIEIPFKKVSPEKLDPWKNPRVTFSGHVVINRKEFEVGPDNSVGDEVIIELNVSAMISGMEVQGLFKRPYGQTLWTKIKTEGIDPAMALVDEFQLKDDADAKRSLSLNFVAMRLEEENRPDDALKFYELNAREFPDNDAVHSNLANAYFRKKMKDKSLEECRKALAINPNNTMALEIMKYYRRQP